MNNPPQILALSGSTRTDSINQKLVEVAAGGAEVVGASVKVIRLKDYSMPLYDGDWEEKHGIPDSARALKALMFSHQGLLIASPEYNSSITAVLKNTIDWLSRREEGEEPLQCFKGKVVSLMSASPGALGGLRGLVHVRSILANLGCIVLPDQVAVPSANRAFDIEGRISGEALQHRIETLGSNLTEILQKLQA